jgi:putative FmdB family regulatory protein
VPLYEYQCKKCRHKFEKIQKFSDRPIKKCPECGGPLEKIQHAPNVQFKGTGWYVTDYAGKKDAAASDGGSEKKETSTKSEDGAKGKEKEKESKPHKAEAKKSEAKKAKD